MHRRPRSIRSSAPLESGRRLNGAGRRACRAAFDENPEGFERIARRALERAEVNPLGLLCRMVLDGDYLEDEQPAAKSREPSSREPSTARKSSFCPSCGSVPLEEGERLVIVEKDVHDALKASRYCQSCGKVVRGSAVGRLYTVGGPFTDEEGEERHGFELVWHHAKCLKEEREEDREAALEMERSRSGSQNRTEAT